MKVTDWLLGIAKVYKEIQEQDKKLGTNHATALIEELAGKNRSNIASAILQDPTQLEAVKKSSEEAIGSAEKELNSYLDSIDGKMAQLENRAQEFWFKVIDSETIKNGIDLLSTLLKGATDFVDTVGLLPTILSGVGVALSFKNVGEWNYISKFHSNNIICFIVWMCRLYSLTYMGKAYKDSVPIMRYIIINKIHTHLYVGRYGLNRLMGNNTMTGNLVPYIIWYI